MWPKPPLSRPSAHERPPRWKASQHMQSRHCWPHKHNTSLHSPRDTQHVQTATAVSARLIACTQPSDLAPPTGRSFTKSNEVSSASRRTRPASAGGRGAARECGGAHVDIHRMSSRVAPHRRRSRPEHLAGLQQKAMLQTGAVVARPKQRQPRLSKRVGHRCSDESVRRTRRCHGVTAQAPAARLRGAIIAVALALSRAPTAGTAKAMAPSSPST